VYQNGPIQEVISRGWYLDACRTGIPALDRLRRPRAVRVLLVEAHDPPLRNLRRDLEEEHFAVDIAADGKEADAKARTTDYDVIVLALPLSGGVDGLALLQLWRHGGLKARALVLIEGGPAERTRCLQAGADDCLASPLEPIEVRARLRALIRRRYGIKGPIIRTHDLEIDTATRTVRRSGQLIQLTPREYSLLEFLAFHRGKVATRASISEHLYDERDQSNSNVVEVYVGYLRNKIDKGFHPPLILTRWRQGYLLRT
jgi:DNA-binding response OmpR family regulator